MPATLSKLNPRILLLRAAANPAGVAQSLRYLAFALIGTHFGAELLKAVGMLKRKQRKDTENNKRRTRVSKDFYKQLRYLLKLVFPRFLCNSTLVLIVHTMFLVARTFLSLYVAYLEGRLVQSIVQGNPMGFIAKLVKWTLLAVPATFVNSMMRYCESSLSLTLRQNLVKKAYDRYFHGQTYYRVSNLDNRLLNPDQCLTEDISNFTDLVAQLYSHISKPVLDILLICITLLRFTTSRGGAVKDSILLCLCVIVVTNFILKRASPRFGSLVAEEASRKGNLRYLHSRVITNSEEIAFYRGHEAEHSLLKRAFSDLCRHSTLIYRTRISYIMLEQFLLKYVWSASGMTMVAIPIFIQRLTGSEYRGDDPDGGVSERTRAFTTARNLLSSGGDAVERLMSSYKEIAELAGYTQRVYNMFRVFEDTASGHFEREALSTSATGTKPKRRVDILDKRGIVTESEDRIVLDNVPIVTPSGDVIVDSLSLQINRGMHLLITGPNGCGKSSLFRILGGLWPVYSGHLQKPRIGDMYYIPQRPYMTIGTLRDQVVYPDSRKDMERKGLTDDDLEKILETVTLNHIIEREGGWDATGDWMDILSGGEKQRMGLARIFYHRPRFAILDECTSAVSIDVEGQIYNAAKDAGITILTVTHRPSLWKYHTHLLQFDGDGKWSFEALGESEIEERLTKAEEVRRLEAELAQVPEKRVRLERLCAILGESSTYLSEDTHHNE